MSEEKVDSQEEGAAKPFLNLDKKFMFLIVLIILYAVSKSCNDTNSIASCQTELLNLYDGDDWRLDSFCVCQNDLLNEKNNWFVKEQIRNHGLIDFFMKADTTGIKVPILKCLKSNVSDPKNKAFALKGGFKELMVSKCMDLVKDPDFNKKHDVELYCSCFMNKNRGKLKINTVFENDFFFIENFMPLDSLCLETSYR